MMRIGDRHYEFVRSQSGFSVTLEPALSVRGPQAWRLDLHYVPADRNLEARPSWELEHLELCFQPFRYQTSDWRERSNFGPGPDLDPILFNITLGNLLDGGFSCPRHAVFPEAITINHTGGYLFRCQFEGVVTRDGQELDLELEEEVPFFEMRIWAGTLPAAILIFI
jgi:hypothetical protein